MYKAKRGTPVMKNVRFNPIGAGRPPTLQKSQLGRPDREVGKESNIPHPMWTGNNLKIVQKNLRVPAHLCELNIMEYKEGITQISPKQAANYNPAKQTDVYKLIQPYNLDYEIHNYFNVSTNRSHHPYLEAIIPQPEPNKDLNKQILILVGDYITAARLLLKNKIDEFVDLREKSRNDIKKLQPEVAQWLLQLINRPPTISSILKINNNSNTNDSSRYTYDPTIITKTKINNTSEKPKTNQNSTPAKKVTQSAKNTQKTKKTTHQKIKKLKPRQKYGKRTNNNQLPCPNEDEDAKLETIGGLGQDKTMYDNPYRNRHEEMLDKTENIEIESNVKINEKQGTALPNPKVKTGEQTGEAINEGPVSQTTQEQPTITYVPATQDQPVMSSNASVIQDPPVGPLYIPPPPHMRHPLNPSTINHGERTHIVRKDITMEQHENMHLVQPNVQTVNVRNRQTIAMMPDMYPQQTQTEVIHPQQHHQHQYQQQQQMEIDSKQQETPSNQQTTNSNVVQQPGVGYTYYQDPPQHSVTFNNPTSDEALAGQIAGVLNNNKMPPKYDNTMPADRGHLIQTPIQPQTTPNLRYPNQYNQQYVPNSTLGGNLSTQQTQQLQTTLNPYGYQVQQQHITGIGVPVGLGTTQTPQVLGSVYTPTPTFTTRM